MTEELENVEKYNQRRKKVIRWITIASVSLFVAGAVYIILGFVMGIAYRSLDTVVAIAGIGFAGIFLAVALIISKDFFELSDIRLNINQKRQSQIDEKIQRLDEKMTKIDEKLSKIADKLR